MLDAGHRSKRDVALVVGIDRLCVDHEDACLFGQLDRPLVTDLHGYSPFVGDQPRLAVVDAQPSLGRLDRGLVKRGRIAIRHERRVPTHGRIDPRAKIIDGFFALHARRKRLHDLRPELRRSGRTVDRDNGLLRIAHVGLASPVLGRRLRNLIGHFSSLSLDRFYCRARGRISRCTASMMDWSGYATGLRFRPEFALCWPCR